MPTLFDYKLAIGRIVLGTPEHIPEKIWKQFSHAQDIMGWSFYSCPGEMKDLPPKSFRTLATYWLEQKCGLKTRKFEFKLEPTANVKGWHFAIEFTDGLS